MNEEEQKATELEASYPGVGAGNPTPEAGGARPHCDVASKAHEGASTTKKPKLTIIPERKRE